MSEVRRHTGKNRVKQTAEIGSAAEPKKRPKPNTWKCPLVACHSLEPKNQRESQKGSEDPFLLSGESLPTITQRSPNAGQKYRPVLIVWPCVESQWRESHSRFGRKGRRRRKGALRRWGRENPSRPKQQTIFAGFQKVGVTSNKCTRPGVLPAPSLASVPALLVPALVVRALWIDGLGLFLFVLMLLVCQGSHLPPSDRETERRGF